MQGKSARKSSNVAINNDSKINLDTTIGCFTLLESIILITIIGLLSTIVFSFSIINYFRPAILITIIPITVTSITLYGILRQKHSYLWPLIAHSVSYYFI
ncbi:unnamed protein product [Onchocerca flexuosa]|uniref:Uncharacterized protein n=1 Tax=Onchocerca flexuosa TaxID=387005 RepID=A0A183HSE4_9BILA|nr:unnamed protein product [Onchocerca flexuosa]